VSAETAAPAIVRPAPDEAAAPWRRIRLGRVGGIVALGLLVPILA